jgi:hypothetical protein
MIKSWIFEFCSSARPATRTGAGHIVGYPFASIPRELVARSYELWSEVIRALGA